jgi:hypothetical protein
MLFCILIGSGFNEVDNNASLVLCFVYHLMHCFYTHVSRDVQFKAIDVFSGVVPFISNELIYAVKIRPFISV